MWQAGDHGPIAGGIVVQLKQWCGDQLIVSRNGKESLLGQLHNEQFLVLLGPGNVRRDIGILGGLEIRPPPVGDDVANSPLCRHAVFPPEGIVDDAEHALLLVLAWVELPTGQLEEGCAGGAGTWREGERKGGESKRGDGEEEGSREKKERERIEENGRRG